MSKTSIEWTGYSWNPIRARHKNTGKVGWHCVLHSPGCTNCYAQSMNRRLGTGLPYTAGSSDQIELFLDEKVLREPLTWRKPRMVFVCSMTDLFADFVPDEWLDKMFSVMGMCAGNPQHTFQLLTKRTERMREYLGMVSDERDMQRWAQWAADLAESPCAPGIFDDVDWPLPNVWCGTSVENQEQADKRIPHLLATYAAVRFLSAEPLLGTLDIKQYLSHNTPLGRDVAEQRAAGIPSVLRDRRTTAILREAGAGVDWVICGGESGSNARPCELANIRSIVKQCRSARVQVFVKQLGSRILIPNDSFGEWPREGDDLIHFPDNDDEMMYQGKPTMVRTQHPKGGEPAEWPKDVRVREMPARKLETATT